MQFVNCHITFKDYIRTMHYIFNVILILSFILHIYKSISNCRGKSEGINNEKSVLRKKSHVLFAVFELDGISFNSMLSICLIKNDWQEVEI